MNKKTTGIYSLIAVLFCVTTSLYGVISLDKNVYNAGNVKSVDIVFAEFIIKNKSDKAVNLTLENESKNCSALSYPNKLTISPQKEYNLLVQFIPKNCESGKFEQTIILSDGKEKKTIIFKADIQGDISLNNLPNTSQKKYTNVENRTIYVAYFYKVGCLKCVNAENILKNLGTNVIIKEFNILKPENIVLAKALAERCKVPEDAQLITPTIYIGDYFLIGNAITKDNMQKLLKVYTDNMSKPPWDISQKQKIKFNSDLLNKFNSFSVISVFTAGLIDGINPCAFAILIFLLSYLQVAKYTRKQLIIFGLLYTLCVFLSYLFIGLGLFHGISFLLVKYPKITIYFYWATGILAMIFAFLSLIDIFIVLKKNAKGMILQLSDNVKKRTRLIIRNNAGKTFLISSIIFTAISVSLLELGCTGQIYLPIITFIIQTAHSSLKAILYLLLYNLAFILPLLIIFLLFIFGFRHQNISNLFQKRIVLIKILMTVLFFALGLFILLGI
jgi:cytochrome c biogenesis protein CcdA